MEISHAKIHDLITRAMKVEPLAEQEYEYRVSTREQVLGMRYNRGEQVIDRVTGKGGEVIGGQREAVITS